MVVEVAGGGSQLEMEHCHVEGGRTSAGGAVRVGSSGSLSARQCVLHSKGNGLCVCEGGKAVLRDCRVNGCGFSGVKVEGASVHMKCSEICRHAWPNVWVDEKGHADLEHVISNGSKSSGLLARGQSSACATHSEASGNGRMGAVATNQASLTLRHCTCSCNHGYGIRAVDSGVILAEHTQAIKNKYGNSAEWSQASITCHGCDLGGQAVKQQW